MSYIYIIKRNLMQAIMDAATRGYVFHTQGEVQIDKYPGLIKKFNDLYEIGRNKNQRYYAKNKGKANVKFFAYFDESKSCFAWWMLSTKGEGNIHKLEKMKVWSDKRTKIRVPGDYELVRITRKKKNGGGQTTTWRMTKETYLGWQLQIESHCKRRNKAMLHRCVSELRRLPGNAGIRQQIGQLMQFMQMKWKRFAREKESFVIMKLPYLQREATEKISFEQWYEGWVRSHMNKK